MAGAAWLTDAGAAFAQARAQGRPLFLYWGAVWCPPCNRTKATVFQHPRFGALAARAVLLHLDGDAPGAQVLGDQYGLRSYPTLVVCRPDGAEVTRLPCEVDGARFLSLLDLALDLAADGATSAAAALAKAEAGTPLSEAEWTLLGFYSWDTDEGRLLGQRQLGPTLLALAGACPQAEARTRFLWFALQAGAAPAGADLCATLADPAAVRAQLDLVCNLGPDLVRALSEAESEERTRLAAAWSGALAGIENDLGLHLSDRLQALRSRVRLARLGGPAVELGAVRARVATALLVTQEAALRHVVVNSGAGILSDAGLLDAAQEVLEGELERSHAPWYFMHNLAAVAKKRGDAADALSWYERAWQAARGPATRTQWGVAYLMALPDGATVGAVYQQILAAAQDPQAQRNRIQLARAAARLGASGA